GGQGGGLDPGHRQWRHHLARRGRPGIARIRRRRFDDRAWVLWAAVVHRTGHRMAALAAAPPGSAARRAIPDPEPSLRGDARPLRDAGRPYRAEAHRLVLEGVARLGRVPRRGQPHRGGGAGQGADARVLRAAVGTSGGVMLSSLRRGRSQARPAAIPDTTALLAALPDPVLALDRAGIVRFVNPAAEQFFGT